MKPLINTENIEEWILLYVDKELSQEQEQQLEQFLETHPGQRELLKTYRATRLLPEPLETFPGKENLFQRKAIHRFLWIRSQPVIRLTAAALLLVALGIWFFRTNYTAPADHPASATTGQVATLPVDADTMPAATVPTRRQEARQPAAGRTKTQPAIAFSRPGKPTDKMPEADTAIRKVTALQPIRRLQAPVPMATTMTTSRKVPTVAVSLEIRNEAPHRNAAATLSAPPAKRITIDIPNWLPVEQERLQGINDLIGQMQEVKQKLLSDLSELNLSAVAVQVGNQRIILGKKDSF